jgi:hypothetical protein
MTPTEIEEHIIETYDKILDLTMKMKNGKDSFKSYHFDLNDLLCRVGELESSLKYWNDKQKNDNAEPATNRLCKCYDTGEREFHEQENSYDENDYDDYDDYYDYGCGCNCCSH